MCYFKVKKVVDRLNQMVDNAIEGKVIEQSFDETKMSSLESKLAHFLHQSLEEKNQLLDQKLKVHELISDISHQTKTPLSNILLHTMMLEECDLGENEKLYVNVLTKQTEKLSFLINTLITASRLEAGMIRPMPQLVDVSTLVDEVIQQSHPKAAQKNIQIVKKTIEAKANFDLKWTSEALINIVDNAIKYSPTDSVIQIVVTSYELFCRIDVIDQGIGITEDEYPKIFQRFYRSDIVRDQEGVGLGLYLAREIIRKQEGYIKVQSKPNEGSVFSVFLQT